MPMVAIGLNGPGQRMGVWDRSRQCQIVDTDLGSGTLGDLAVAKNVDEPLRIANLDRISGAMGQRAHRAALRTSTTATNR